MADNDTKDLASDARKYWSADGYTRGGVIREVDYASQSGGLNPALKGIKIVDCDTHLTEAPDLFTSRAAAKFKDRMPHVIDGPKGPEWVSAKGAKFGLVNGMGSAGREYVPGIIHRSDRMASTGLYDDGKKGIRRLTEVDLRLKDQERDGVQAEVLYGVLGSSGRLNDPEAALEMLRIYNDWLHDFCQQAPDRLVGLANLPNYDMKESVAEAA